MAKSFDAELSLVHINAPNEMDIRNDNALLDDIRENFADETFTIESIKADSVNSGLQTGINLFQSDILVVSSHGRTFLSQLVNPSKSQELADSINLPLLVLHFQG